MALKKFWKSIKTFFVKIWNGIKKIGNGIKYVVIPVWSRVLAFGESLWRILWLGVMFLLIPPLAVLTLVQGLFLFEYPPPVKEYFVTLSTWATTEDPPWWRWTLTLVFISIFVFLIF